MIARGGDRRQTRPAASGGITGRPVAKVPDLAGQTGHHHLPPALRAPFPGTPGDCEFVFVRVSVGILAECSLARCDRVNGSATDPHLPGSLPLRPTRRQQLPDLLDDRRFKHGLVPFAGVPSAGEQSIISNLLGNPNRDHGSKKGTTLQTEFGHLYTYCCCKVGKLWRLQSTRRSIALQGPAAGRCRIAWPAADDGPGLPTAEGSALHYRSTGAPECLQNWSIWRWS